MVAYVRLQLTFLLLACTVRWLGCTVGAVLVDELYTWETCSGSDKAAKKQAMIAAMGEAILRKLGLEAALPPSNASSTAAANVDEHILASYRASVEAARGRGLRESADHDRESCSGPKESIFAKKISVYFPVSYNSLPSTSVLNAQPFQETNDLGKRQTLDENFVVDYFLAQLTSPTVYKLSFNLNELDSDLVLAHAELRLFKKSFDSLIHISSYVPRPAEKVEVYTVSHIVDSETGLVSPTELVASKEVEGIGDNFISFDISQALQRCLEEGSSELELEVVIKCPESLSSGIPFPPAIKFVTKPDEQLANPAQLVVAFLQMQEAERNVRDSSGKVHKRQDPVDSTYCLTNPSEPNCCLRELEIDFQQDLGWDFVLQPQSFHSNYCEGLCPAHWPAHSMSTTLLIKYKEMNPTAAVKPCCVPAVLKPLVVLIVHNGIPQLEELTDVIVESCICR